MASKISKKLWIAYKFRDEEKDAPLAYLTADDGDSATKKRQETGRGWAASTEYDRVTRENKRYAPVEKTFDNEAISGFRIESHETRYVTSNVVWRIIDPRGFKCEIYSGNMEAIMLHGHIEKGEIKSRCIWGREGGKNILLPEGTPEFDEAVAFTTKTEVTAKASDVQPGDTIILTSGAEVQYLGRFFCLTPTVEYAYTTGNRECVSQPTFKKSEKASYFAKGTDGTWYMMGKLEVASIVKKGDGKVTPQSAVKFINQAIVFDRPEFYTAKQNNRTRVMHVSVTSYTTAQIEIDVDRETELNQFFLKLKDGDWYRSEYYSRGVVIERPAGLYLFYNFHQQGGQAIISGSALSTSFPCRVIAKQYVGKHQWYGTVMQEVVEQFNRQAVVDRSVRIHPLVLKVGDEVMPFYR